MHHARSLSEDLSVEQFLEQCRGRYAPETLSLVRMIVEGFDAADVDRASVKAIAEEWGGSSLESQARPLGGYAPLVAHLARALDPGGRSRVMLDTAVETIQWGGALVRVTARQAARSVALSARCAIVTLPVSILQLQAAEPGAVRFEPEIKQTRAALQGLAPGAVVKVVLQFKRAFWDDLHDGRFKHAKFLHSPSEPFPTLWTALPLRLPLLTAWTGGPNARRLAGASRDQVAEQALSSSQHILGVGERPLLDEFVAAHMHDWTADAYSRGAYCYLTVGGQKRAAELRHPLGDRLYFAGDGADPDSTGTVEAALASGRAAARSALQRL
jgi:monoamine oxidase